MFDHAHRELVVGVELNLYNIKITGRFTKLHFDLLKIPI